MLLCILSTLWNSRRHDVLTLARLKRSSREGRLRLFLVPSMISAGEHGIISELEEEMGYLISSRMEVSIRAVLSGLRCRCSRRHS